MASIGQRLKRGWNAFLGRDPTRGYGDYGISSAYPLDRSYASFVGYERTILNSIFCRISMDVAAIRFEHVLLDENGRYKEKVCSGLHDCLTMEANLDQSGREFIQDVVYNMFDEGVIAIVATDLTANPDLTESYDVLKMRVGKIVRWYPKHVAVEVYNEETGLRDTIIRPKASVAIVTNPLRAVINETNAALQRLIRTLNQLDRSDEQNSSGRLDLIIQLPYSLKNEMKLEQAKMRKKDIEDQLTNSPHGIAYIDSTEHVTQLNRAVENNYWERINTLTQQVYDQVGLTKAVLDGTATEEQMMNYFNNTIEPICAAISDALTRKFISKNARTRGHAIKFFRDPFKLVPAKELAEIGDKMSRNELMSSNELRSIIGFKPVEDPRADELRNKNINKSNAEMEEAPMSTEEVAGEQKESTGELLKSLGVPNAEELNKNKQ